MKNLIIFLSLIFAVSAYSAEDFYSLKAAKINGDTLHFSELRGKKLMIVNVASLCGYTGQYAQLQSLYEQFGGDKFEIIGFPANNFSNQEPGSDEDIEDFCKENYGVTFTMMSKISVKGTDKHPVYQWLTEYNKNGVTNQEVLWNFQKWMITEDGKIWRIISTETSPLHKDIINWLSINTSITDNSSDATDVMIFPNPATDIITLKANTEIDLNTSSIQVFDLQGKVAKSINLSNENFQGDININISELASGTYYILFANKLHFFIKN